MACWLFLKNQSGHSVENGPREEAWEWEGRFGHSRDCWARGAGGLGIHGLCLGRSGRQADHQPWEEAEEKAQPQSTGSLSQAPVWFPCPLSSWDLLCDSLIASGRATCSDLIQGARGLPPRSEMDTQAMSTLMVFVLLLALGLSRKPSEPRFPHLMGHTRQSSCWPFRKCCFRQL